MTSIEELKNFYKKKREEAIKSESYVFYFCSYVPPEIIHASGLIPFRYIPPPMFPVKTDEIMPKYVCPYLRSITEEKLREDFYMKKVIFTDGCDSSKRIYEVWKEMKLSDDTYFLEVPFGEEKKDIKFFSDELKKLFLHLSKNKSSPEKIFDSIEIYNRARKKIREEEKNINGIGKGTFLFYMHNLFNSMDPEEFLKLNFSFNGKKGKVKLYLFSTMYPYELVEYLEEIGVEIVYDDSCFGERILEDVYLLSDPFETLSFYLLKREGCVRRREIEDKISFIENRVREMNLDGVIFYSLKYCDPLLFYIPVLRKRLKEKGIKTLLLEDDFTMGIRGQIRTRVEAFMEMIG